MNAYTKPLPKVDDRNRSHWEGAKQRELRVQKCRNCGALRYPPAPICSQCHSSETDWAKVSGRGKVWSWCVFHRAYFKDFPMPYTTVLIELEEGPKLYSNLVGVPTERLRIGLPVRALFEDVTPEVTLIKFEEDAR